MVDYSQIFQYSAPVVVSVLNGLFLRYKQTDNITIAVSSVIILILVSIFTYLYTNVFVNEPDPSVDAEVKKLKQENAGLKSNLMKIHREIIPNTKRMQGPPEQMRPKVSFDQSTKPMKPPPKIEEIVQEKGSGVFSEAEDAKPFEQ